MRPSKQTQRTPNCGRRKTLIDADKKKICFNNKLALVKILRGQVCFIYMYALSRTHANACWRSIVCRLQ